MFLLTIIIGLLGFLPLFIVLWKRRSINNLKEKGDRVTGVVEDIKEYTGYRGSRYYKALIRYTVFGGRTIFGTYTYSSSRKKPLFIRGELTEVYYSKTKPERFIPKKVSGSIAALVFTIIMAAGYIVLSFFLYRFIKNGGG